MIDGATTPNLKSLWQNNRRSFEIYIEGDQLIAVPGIDETLELPRRLPIVRIDWFEEVINTSQKYEHIRDRLRESERIQLGESGVVEYAGLELSVLDLFDILLDIKREKLDNGTPIAHGYWHDIWPTLMSAFSIPLIDDSRGTNVTVHGVPNTIDVQETRLDDPDSVPNVLTSQYCTYVKEATRWYQAGLLPVNFYEQPDTDIVAKLMAGEVAAILSGYTVRDWDKIVATVQEDIYVDDSVRLAILPPPTYLAQGTHRGSRRNGTFLVLGAHASDEQVQAALQTLDYVKLTPEGYVLEAYGIEGTHYDWGAGQTRYVGPPESVRNHGSPAPHLPRYPRFRGDYLYEVMFRSAALEMIKIISGKGAREWALSPDIWMDRWYENASPRLREIGESVNSFIEKEFVRLVTSNVNLIQKEDLLDKMCKASQTMTEEDGVGEAWELTIEFGSRQDV